MPKLNRAARPATEDVLEPLLMEFSEHKKMADQLNDRLSAVKARLMDILERRGEPDERGSLWIHLPNPVAGFKAVKRERRVAIRLDEDRAEQILRERGCYEECTDAVVTLDGADLDYALRTLADADIKVATYRQAINDDKIMQRYYYDKQNRKGEPGALTDVDVDSMFVENSSWAFKAIA